MKISYRSVRSLKWLLRLIAAAATVFAVAWAVENWRGDHAWHALAREYADKGESLDYAAYRSPSIPDERNLFRAPLLVSLLESNDPARRELLFKTHLQEISAAIAEVVPQPGSFPDFSRLRFALQIQLRQYHLFTEKFSDPPAADVLRALKPLEPLLDEFRQNVHDRPDGALNLDTYFRSGASWGPLLELAEVLSARADALIELGHVDQALADNLAVLGMARALLRDSKTILETLLGDVIALRTLSSFKEGCSRHLWTDPQLTSYAQLLLDCRPLQSLDQALRVGQVGQLYYLDHLDSVPWGEKAPFWLHFHGWAQQNKVSLGSLFEHDVFPAFDAKTNRIFLERLKDLKALGSVLEASRSPYDWAAARQGKFLGEIIANVGHAQEVLIYATTAAALERHRIIQGELPARLEELEPMLIPAVPCGVFDGRPLRYTRSPAGGYQLAAEGGDKDSAWDQTESSQSAK